MSVSLKSAPAKEEEEKKIEEGVSEYQENKASTKRNMHASGKIFIKFVRISFIGSNHEDFEAEFTFKEVG